MDKFDLEKRTEDLGVAVVVFCRLINRDAELRIISNQLLR
jgi:hypothetical protein